MNWRTVFAPLQENQVEQLALAAQGFIAYLINPIDVSLITRRLPSIEYPWLNLQLVCFASRVPVCRVPPSCIAESIADSPMAINQGAKILDEMAADPQVYLAILASRLGGQGLYATFSDKLCCSGYLYFENGRLRHGEVIGWEGNDQHWHFAQGHFELEEIEVDGEMYPKPFIKGMDRILGPGTAEKFLSDEQTIPRGVEMRYQLMAKRTLIHPIVGRNE